MFTYPGVEKSFISLFIKIPVDSERKKAPNLEFGAVNNYNKKSEVEQLTQS